MAEPKDPAKEMTAADAAKLVFRTVPKVADGKVVLDKDGKPVMVKKAIDEKEVLSFKDYGPHVVVVTIDGQKFQGDK